MPTNRNLHLIHFAVQLCSEPLIELLCREDPNAIYALDKQLNSPLHIACMNDFSLELKQMIAKINLIIPLLRLSPGYRSKPNLYGSTPVHFLAYCFIPFYIKGCVISTAMVKTLILESGLADPTYRDEENRMMLDHPNDNQYTILNLAAVAGRGDLMEFILQCGSQALMDRDELRMTPVESALYFQHDDCAKICFALGATLSIKNSRSFTKGRHIAGYTYPLPWDYIRDVKYRVYFTLSLTERLLRCLFLS